MVKPRVLYKCHRSHSVYFVSYRGNSVGIMSVIAHNECNISVSEAIVRELCACQSTELGYFVKVKGGIRIFCEGQRQE